MDDYSVIYDSDSSAPESFNAPSPSSEESEIEYSYTSSSDAAMEISDESDTNDVMIDDLHNMSRTETESSESVDLRLFENINKSVNENVNENVEFTENQNDETLDIFASVVEDMFLSLIMSNVTRTNLNKVATSLQNMIDTLEVLVTSKCVDDCIGEIMFLFSNIKETIKSYSTEYRRKKKIKENPFYIEPIPIAYGSVPKPVRHKYKQTILEKPLILYKIPVRESLEALFKCENFEKCFFETTMNHNCSPDIFTNVCCGSQFQENYRGGKCVVMIQLYYDGINLGDPLKQNKNRFRIGAFYYRVLNLPPEMQSLQQNIHLCGVFNENDIKHNKEEGLNIVLKHIVDMFKELETNGLELISVNDSQTTLLDVALVSTAFDNLGCHQVVGMSDSFTTHYCCVHCYITSREIKQKVGLNDIEQRNNSNFYQHLNETPRGSNNFLERTKGIHRESKLCALQFFKIPESIAGDIFHDIDQGFGRVVLDYYKNLFVSKETISEQEFENRILTFDYGYLDINLRPSNTAHMSGIQIRNLLYRFNFIFHDLAEYHLFQLTATLSKILQIVHSNKLRTNNINILRELIHRLKTIWRDRMKNTFIPKAHFLEHYADIIMKVGPLTLCDTAPYEMHHRILKRVSEKNAQFTNILKSCAERHQLNWANKWKIGEFHTLKITGKGAKKKINMENIISFPVQVDWTKDIYEVPKASYVFDYKRGLFVVRREEDNYCFYKIEAVFLISEKIYLKCKRVKTQYNGFFAAHKIINEETTISIIIDIAELEIKETFEIIKPFNHDNVKYILCKRNVI